MTRRQFRDTRGRFITAPRASYLWEVSRDYRSVVVRRSKATRIVAAIPKATVTRARHAGLSTIEIARRVIAHVPVFRVKRPGKAPPKPGRFRIAPVTDWLPAAGAMGPAFKAAGIKADWNEERERVLAASKVRRPRVAGEVKYFPRLPDVYRPDLKLFYEREMDDKEMQATRFTRAYIWASVEVWPSGEGYKVPARLVVSPPPRGLLGADEKPRKGQRPVLTMIGLPVTRGRLSELGRKPLNMEEWSDFLNRRTGTHYPVWSNAVMGYLKAKNILGRPVDLIGYLPTESAKRKPVEGRKGRKR